VVLCVPRGECLTVLLKMSALSVVAALPRPAPAGQTWVSGLADLGCLAFFVAAALKPRPPGPTPSPSHHPRQPHPHTISRLTTHREVFSDSSFAYCETRRDRNRRASARPRYTDPGEPRPTPVQLLRAGSYSLSTIAYARPAHLQPSLHRGTRSNIHILRPRAAIETRQPAACPGVAIRAAFTARASTLAHSL
jgi:hypothetical protein